MQNLDTQKDSFCLSGLSRSSCSNSSGLSTSSSPNQTTNIESNLSKTMSNQFDQNSQSGLETVFGLNNTFLTNTNQTEIDQYMRDDSIGLEQDPHEWWLQHKTKYPQLSVLAFYYLSIPLVCGALNRYNSLSMIQPALNTFIQEKNYDLFLKHMESCLIKSNLSNLPNICDIFGHKRVQISNNLQVIYNYLWHNWHLTDINMISDF